MMQFRSWIVLLLLPFYLLAETKTVIFEYDGIIAEENTALFAKNLSPLFPVEFSLLEKAIKKAKEIEREGGYEFTFWENYAEVHHLSLKEGWTKAYCIAKTDSLELNEKVISKIQSLREKGVKVALLSSMNPLKKKILSQKGHFTSFDEVILSSEEGFSKLHPRLFEILMEKLGVLPRQCLFVSANVDHIAIAKSLGMGAIVFSLDDRFLSEMP